MACLILEKLLIKMFTDIDGTPYISIVYICSRFLISLFTYRRADNRSLFPRLWKKPFT